MRLSTAFSTMILLFCLARTGLGTALAAVPDTEGPRVVSAVVVESGAYNQIRVTFNEPIEGLSARAITNYSITRFGSTNQVPVQLASYAPVPQPISVVVLIIGTNNWNPGTPTNYYLTVNRVRDAAGNNIAPNTRVGISRYRFRPLLPPNAPWRFQPTHQSGLEPGILQRPWMSAAYSENNFWGQGFMPFCFGGLTPEFVCEAAGPETSVALFRVRFVHTPGTNTADVLRFDYRVQSAAIFYLNGAELTRFNLCPAPAELTNQTPCCVNYIIQPPTTGSAILQATNLVPGTNLLAVAVLSSYCLPPGVQFDRDVSFGLEISGADLETGPVPAENPSMLQIAREQDDTIRLTWTGSGYALESTTNLFSTNATFNWSSVSDVSNPYLLSPSNVPAKAFRLRK